MLKALKKKPADRCAGAADFADDLEAILAHHPVKARPDSRLYRSQMFMRRNRRALAVTVALFNPVLLGSGVAL